MAILTEEQELQVEIAVLTAFISRNNLEVLASRGTLLPNIMNDIFTISKAFIEERNRRKV
jgi:hypothetical protein